MPKPVLRIVVSGIAGSGKSTIGKAIADDLGLRYIDGDSIHPPANIAKMAAGQPLNDDDRWPWLAAVADALRGDDGIVISCSALRRSYRDILRTAGDVRFVFLDITKEVAIERADARKEHFMTSAMIESQIATLEPPEPDEADVSVVSGNQPMDETARASIVALTTIPQP